MCRSCDCSRHIYIWTFRRKILPPSSGQNNNPQVVSTPSVVSFSSCPHINDHVYRTVSFSALKIGAAVSFEVLVHISQTVRRQIQVRGNLNENK